MIRRTKILFILTILLSIGPAPATRGNPPNGKVVLQAFWWDCLNRNFKTDADGTGGWYTYLTKLCPRLRDMGFDGLWAPPPYKGDNAGGMGGGDGRAIRA